MKFTLLTLFVNGYIKYEQIFITHTRDGKIDMI